MNYIVILSLLIAGQLFADEISLLSGLYNKDESVSGDTTVLEKTETTLGGRYGKDLTIDSGFYGSADITMRSYDAAAGVDAPSSTTSLLLGAGYRVYFNEFAEKVVPFIAGFGYFLNDKNIDIANPNYEIKTNGIFYSGKAGLRMLVSKSVFIDCEFTAFTTPLKSTTTTEARDGSSKTETNSSGLYVDTAANLTNGRLIIGMKI